jgi:hypothetical protein
MEEENGITYFYKKTKTEKGVFYGCMAIKRLNGSVSTTKYSFVLTEGPIEETWPWFNNSKGFHTFDIKKLTPETADVVNKNFFIEFEEALEAFLKKDSLPSFVMFNSSDIKGMLNEGYTPLEFESARTFVIFRIVAFFIENPEATFEFPLFLEYVEQDPNCDVEDFLVKMSELANVFLSK